MKKTVKRQSMNPNGKGGSPVMTDAPAPTVIVTWERHGRPAVELLSVKLTDDEQREMGNDLAGVLEEIANQTMREESVKRELKAKMAGLEARRDELASVVRRREQMRNVECIWERNYTEGLARKVRLDTGDVLQSRPLHDSEKQPPLLPEVAKAVDGALVVHSEGEAR